MVIEYNNHMGVNEDFSRSLSFVESFCRSYTREDIPLKLNDSLAERKKKEHLRLCAIGLCIASLLLTLVLCILSFIFASLRHSPATFAFMVMPLETWGCSYPPVDSLLPFGRLQASVEA
ncbi:transmembrane protein 163 [Caerostris extrusa]|uniref:Transmembrane protein 163 n=1 Tax=Caerostris extrusa TaxID=172846 RepID=A0AAV4V6K7_CAEEX|nr:transmembrane protein 163 [Caerostris extrusa]